MRHNIKSLTGIAILFFALLFFSTELTAQNSQLKQSLKDHVYFLASDSLKGRRAGSEENRQAADYILTQFEEMGLMTDTQPFSSPIRGRSEVAEMENIIAVIPGSDPQFEDEWVIIGAHYDHIGLSGNPDSGADVINNGADDNASGVATIIELARLFKDAQPKRSIMFIAFDGEEQGLLGSYHFVRNPIIPLDKIVVMFSLDMVGYLQTSGWLKYEGIGTIGNLKKLITQNSDPDFKVKYKRFETSLMGATDTQPFANYKVPTLYVSTGLLSPYHKPEDEADGIDLDGMVSVTNHVSEVVNIVANNPSVEPSGRFSPLHVSSFPLIDYGVTAGIGSSHFKYRGANVQGVSIASYSAGLFLSADFRYFSIRPEVLYERGGSKHLGYWNFSDRNIYEPVEGKVTFNAITVPVSIKTMPVAIRSGSVPVYGVYLAAGGYYRRMLSISMCDNDIASNDPRFNWNEWGISYGVGVYVLGFTLGYEAKYALNDFMFKINGNHAARNISSQIKFSYQF